MTAALKFGFLSLTLGLLAFAAFGAGCVPEPELSIELMTDLKPGREFDGVYAEVARLEKGERGVEPRCKRKDNLFDDTANYRLGARVGTQQKVQAGETWVVGVALCKGDDLIMSRSIMAEIKRDTELRVVLARDCLEKECAGTAPCDYRTCEPSTKCHWGDLGACQDPACGGPGAKVCPRDFECVAGDCLYASPADVFGDAGPEDAGPRMDGSLQLVGEGGFRAQTPIGAARDTGPAVEDARIGASARDGSTEAAPDGPTPVGDNPFSATNKARVLYVGDALASESLGKLRWWLGLREAVEVHSAVGGRLAICDFLDGKSEGVPAASKLARQIKAHEPHVVVMQFWGDALTSCMADVSAGTQAYLDRYAADAAEAVRQIEQAATAAHIPRPKILWVLQGPESDAGQPLRPRALNQIYQALATLTGDRTVDAGKWVSMELFPYDDAMRDRYKWTQFLPCVEFEQGKPDCIDTAFGPLVQLHRGKSDAGAGAYADEVLFCLGNSDENFACDGPAPGSNRYALQIAGAVNEWLGLPR